MKYTSKVRRGFQQLIERHLERHVEEAIRQATAEGLKRDLRLSAPEVAELRAAVAWIKQEADRELDSSIAPAQAETEQVDSEQPSNG